MNQTYKNIDKLVKHMFDILLPQLHTTPLKSSSERAEETLKGTKEKTLKSRFQDNCFNCFFFFFYVNVTFPDNCGTE